ncbi:unnamed protein product [Peniophora sp. CBMAI 1063]|nr:unnamed protein product [Peniophora sp. CBMAI 1063]
MFTGISTLVLLAVSSVNGSPMPFDKREPQFSFNFTNRLPVNGRLPFGINLAQGANGNSIAMFGNATTGDRGFPFNLLPFKRDELAAFEEMQKRDPQFSFNFTNRLPITGNLPFGLHFSQGADGNSILSFGNATTGDRGFPFNFLPFKRDEELVAREPQFSFNFTNRLPVNGRLPFGINIGQNADGNSIATFGNATTGDRGFPFNFLPFKREEELELVAREPQFSFNFTNRLPVNGRLPFGINIGQNADGNSIAMFGNATTGDRGFPFNFLPFKREEEIQA